MKSPGWYLSAVGLLVVSLLCLASCNSDKKADSKKAREGVRTVEMQPGEAGGTVEDTFTATATISAIDKPNRSVTLKGDDGIKHSFSLGPEVRNFDQLRVGDKVTATVTQRMVVFVRSGSEDPTSAHAEALARAPVGAKPGAMWGEAYEVVAKVQAIDSATRMATLKFADGDTLAVPVRGDVDLSRYKVGDNVVIRVTATVSVIVQKP